MAESVHLRFSRSHLAKSPTPTVNRQAGQVIITIEHDPGAPSGSFMTPTETLVYNGVQFRGTAYRRFFTFTPTVDQVAP